MNAVQQEALQWEKRFDEAGWRVTIGDARGWKAQHLATGEETRFKPTLKALLRHCRATNRADRRPA